MQVSGPFKKNTFKRHQFSWNCDFVFGKLSRIKWLSHLPKLKVNQAEILKPDLHYWLCVLLICVVRYVRSYSIIYLTGS